MPSMTRAGYTPPKQPEKAPETRAPQKKKPKKRHKKQRNTAAVVSVVIFLIAACVAAATLYLYVTTSPYQNAFLPGTNLAGYSLAGLSYEDGEALLRQQTQESVDGWAFEIVWESDTWTLTAQDIELHVDAEATLGELWQQGREGGMVSRFVKMLDLAAEPMSAKPVLAYSMEPVDALLEAVRADVECGSVDATVAYAPGSSEPFAFTDESEGRALDTSGLRTQIERAILALTGESMQLEPQILSPDVTRVQLEGAISLRSRVILAVQADEATLSNLMLAAGALSGLRVEAGESLSFNEAVGARSAQRGYLTASEPAYGVNVSGTGGGVCALSSALYQAALLGGIEIESRSAAVRPVPYCEMGQEAAVSDQGLDLVLRNQTAYPLFVSARVYEDGEGNACVEVQLIGEILGSRYALETQALETQMITEPVYVRDREGTYAEYTDERVPAGDGEPGYSALVELVEYDAQGAEIARSVVGEDIYEPLAPIVYVGVKER